MVIQIIIAILLLVTVILDFISHDVKRGTIITLILVVAWTVVTIMMMFYK